MLRRSAIVKATLRMASLVMVLCLPGSGAAVAQDSAAAGLSVGAISDLDLDVVREIIERSSGAPVPDSGLRRALSLEQAVQLSLEQNLGLQVSVLAVESSDLGLRANQSKFHPTLEVSGGARETKRGYSDSSQLDEFTQDQDAMAYLRQEVPTGGKVSLGIGYARQYTDENYKDQNGALVGNYQTESEIAGLGIEIVQPLLRGGRVFVARQEILDAQYDTEISRADLRTKILSVTAETKVAYYRAIESIRAIQVVENALERDATLIRASRALFDAGSVSKVDVYSAEINQASDLARLATTRAEAEVAQNQLREVLGVPIDVQVDITDTTIPFEPIQIELDTWIQRALDYRPEMLRVKTELDKVQLQVRVSKNDTLPSFDVGGGFQPGFDWDSWNWSARGEFRYQIGNVAARSRLKQARVAEARLRREYVQQQRQIELEVRQIEIRLRQSLEQLSNLIFAVENSRLKRQIALGRFEMGLANNRDIRNADEELIRSESELLRALVGYASDLARLEAAIGGPFDR